MDVDQLRALLKGVAAGKVAVEQAAERLRQLPFERLPYATVDHHRALRCGSPEVIFCQGKQTEHVIGIAKSLSSAGHRVLATRASEEQLGALAAEFPRATINKLARTAVIDSPVKSTAGHVEATSSSLGGSARAEWSSAAEGSGSGANAPVVLISAGTADAPVAEEAAVTLEAMGAFFHRINDVGVSGLHRLLAHLQTLQEACAIIVVAGMEGALPSVVGGLVACPVFAVPTSVGYGASFGGLAALLGMLNSCASNISVLNIDNGFGAAYSASLVYRMLQKSREGKQSRS